MPLTLTLNGSERITIRSSTPDRFEVEAAYQPHGERPPLHTHPRHEEHFLVRSGVLRVDVGGRVMDVQAGESFEIPRGTPHRMWNAGDEVATVRWISTPAAGVEAFFRAMDRLQREGRTGLVDLAGVLRGHRDVMRPASVLTRMLVSILGRLRPAASGTPERTGAQA